MSQLTRKVAHIIDGTIVNVLPYPVKTDSPKYGLVDITDAVPFPAIGDEYDVNNILPAETLVSAVRDRIVLIKEESAQLIAALNWKIERSNEQPELFDKREVKAERQAIRDASNQAEIDVLALGANQATDIDAVKSFKWSVPAFVIPVERKITVAAFYTRLDSKLPVLLSLSDTLAVSGDYALKADLMRIDKLEYVDLDDEVLRLGLNATQQFNSDELNALFVDGKPREVPEALK